MLPSPNELDEGLLDREFHTNLETEKKQVMYNLCHAVHVSDFQQVHNL